jgi:hypothetical protein
VVQQALALTKVGYNLNVTTDGKEKIQKFDDSLFDLLTTDIRIGLILQSALAGGPKPLWTERKAPSYTFKSLTGKVGDFLKMRRGLFFFLKIPLGENWNIFLIISSKGPLGLQPNRKKSNRRPADGMAF